MAFQYSQGVSGLDNALSRLDTKIKGKIYSKYTNDLGNLKANLNQESSIWNIIGSTSGTTTGLYGIGKGAIKSINKIKDTVNEARDTINEARENFNELRDTANQVRQTFTTTEETTEAAETPAEDETPISLESFSGFQDTGLIGNVDEEEYDPEDEEVLFEANEPYPQESNEIVGSGAFQRMGETKQSIEDITNTEPEETTAPDELVLDEPEAAAPQEATDSLELTQLEPVGENLFQSTSTLARTVNPGIYGQSESMLFDNNFSYASNDNDIGFFSNLFGGRETTVMGQLGRKLGGTLDNYNPFRSPAPTETEQVLSQIEEKQGELEQSLQETVPEGTKFVTNQSGRVVGFLGELKQTPTQPQNIEMTEMISSPEETTAPSQYQEFGKTDGPDELDTEFGEFADPNYTLGQVGSSDPYMTDTTTGLIEQVDDKPSSYPSTFEGSSQLESEQPQNIEMTAMGESKISDPLQEAPTAEIEQTADAPLSTTTETAPTQTIEMTDFSTTADTAADVAADTAAETGELVTDAVVTAGTEAAVDATAAAVVGATDAAVGWVPIAGQIAMVGTGIALAGVGIYEAVKNAEDLKTQTQELQQKQQQEENSIMNVAGKFAMPSFTSIHAFNS